MHHYNDNNNNNNNSTLHCKTETVCSIFPFLQTNITSQTWPSGGKGGNCRRRSEVNCRMSSELNCKRSSEVNCRKSSELSCRMSSKVNCRKSSEVNCRMSSELNCRMSSEVNQAPPKQSAVCSTCIIPALPVNCQFIWMACAFGMSATQPISGWL